MVAFLKLNVSETNGDSGLLLLGAYIGKCHKGSRVVTLPMTSRDSTSPHHSP